MYDMDPRLRQMMLARALGNYPAGGMSGAPGGGPLTNAPPVAAPAPVPPAVPQQPAQQAMAPRPISHNPWDPNSLTQRVLRPMWHGDMSTWWRNLSDMGKGR